jgi:hypothetical protein
MAFDTSQLYTGSEFSPTIVPGVYATSELFIDNGPSYGEPNTSLTIARAPEPSAFLLSAIGLVALGLAHARRRPKADRRPPEESRV